MRFGKITGSCYVFQAAMAVEHLHLPPGYLT